MRKLREGENIERGQGGEVERDGGHGGVLHQNHAVIFSTEGGGDHSTAEDSDGLLGNKQEANYDDGGMKLAENYSNISYRDPDPILEKYASDQWDKMEYSTKRTQIKLNPLYHNYS